MEHENHNEPNFANRGIRVIDIADEEYKGLPPVSLKLFITGSDMDEAAFEAIHAARTKFVVDYRPGNEPYAEFGVLIYRGIKKIQALSEALLEIKRDTREDVEHDPELQAQRDPQFGARARKRLERRLALARREFEAARKIALASAPKKSA